MARVNVGVNPKYLSDQHLIAESVEITMITGGLRKNKYLIKSPIPEMFNLGTGHINFFKNKILYLYKRLHEVNKEMSKRNFKHSTVINLDEYPVELINNWIPDAKSSDIIRNRIVERLFKPKSGKLNFHKYYRTTISDVKTFTDNIKNSEIFYV